MINDKYHSGWCSFTEISRDDALRAYESGRPVLVGWYSFYDDKHHTRTAEKGLNCSIEKVEAWFNKQGVKQDEWMYLVPCRESSDEQARIYYAGYTRFYAHYNDTRMSYAEYVKKNK